MRQGRSYRPLPTAANGETHRRRAARRRIGARGARDAQSDQYAGRRADGRRRGRGARGAAERLRRRQSGDEADY